MDSTEAQLRFGSALSDVTDPAHPGHPMHAPFTRTQPRERGAPTGGVAGGVTSREEQRLLQTVETGRRTCPGGLARTRLGTGEGEWYPLFMGGLQARMWQNMRSGVGWGGVGWAK